MGYHIEDHLEEHLKPFLMAYSACLENGEVEPARLESFLEKIFFSASRKQKEFNQIVLKVMLGENLKDATKELVDIFTNGEAMIKRLNFQSDCDAVEIFYNAFDYD